LDGSLAEEVGGPGGEIATSDGGSITVWREDGSSFGLPGDQAVFSPDGSLVASTHVLDVPIANVADGSVRTTLVHPRRATALAFSADDTRLVAGTIGGYVSVWDIASATEMATFRVGDLGPAATIAVAISADGNTVAASGIDEAVVWDVDTGRERGRLPGADTLRIDPAGEVIITSGRAQTRRWSADGRLLSETRLGISPLTTGLSADGHFVGTVDGQDGSITVWDTESGTPIERFPEVGGFPISIAFARNDTTIVANVLSEHQHIVELTCDACFPLDYLLTLARSRVTRGLSDQERSTYLGD
jgi:WD40 repeat protein